MRFPPWVNEGLNGGRGSDWCGLPTKTRNSDVTSTPSPFGSAAAPARFVPMRLDDISTSSKP